MQVSSPGPAGKLLSPYQKPVRLFLQLIRNHSIAGSWVLDATGGSGRNLCSFPLFQLVASSYNIIETCDIYVFAFLLCDIYYMSRNNSGSLCDWWIQLCQRGQGRDMRRGDAVPHALSQFASGTLGRVQRDLGGAAGGCGNGAAGG